MKVSIVNVNYNSYEQLEKYLKSLQTAFEKCKDLNLEVYIADNSSQKQELSFTHSFDCSIVPLENLGYFGGAFEVINANQRIRESDYVIISNVDLQVAENFFVELQKVKISDTTAWLAPQIYSTAENAPKNHRIKLTRPSKKRIFLLMLSFKFPLVQKIYIKTMFKHRNERMETKTFPQSFIYSGHGSFFILTKKFFVLIGDKRLEYKPFLYGEEYYLAELIRMYRGGASIFQTC